MTKTEEPQRFIPFPIPTPDSPVVPAIPKELVKHYEKVRGGLFRPASEILLVLCGHSFDEEFTSKKARFKEKAEGMSPSEFMNRAWLAARREFERQVQELRTRYLCVREEGGSCRLEIEVLTADVEFLDDGEWQEEPTYEKDYELGLDFVPFVYVAETRARGKIRVKCVPPRRVR